MDKQIAIKSLAISGLEYDQVYESGPPLISPTAAEFRFIMALDDLEPYPQAQDFVDRIRRFQPLVHGHNTFVGEGLRKVAKLVKLAYDGFQHRARILSCVERLLRLYEDILHPDSGLDIVSDAPGTPLNLHLQTLESIVAKFGGDIEEHLQPRDRGWIRRLRLNRICAKARLVILAECKAARQSLGLVSRNGKIATRHLEHLQPFDSGLSTAFGVAMRRLDLDPALVDLPQDNKLPVVEYYSAIADLIGSIDFDAVDTHLSRSQSKTPRSLSKIGTDVELCRNFLKDIKKECDPASLHFPTPVAINQWRLVAQGTIELVPLFAEDGHEMRLLQPVCACMKLTSLLLLSHSSSAKTPPTSPRPSTHLPTSQHALLLHLAQPQQQPQVPLPRLQPTQTRARTSRLRRPRCLGSAWTLSTCARRCMKATPASPS